jgi:hypothetical protein
MCQTQHPCCASTWLRPIIGHSSMGAIGADADSLRKRRRPATGLRQKARSACGASSPRRPVRQLGPRSRRASRERQCEATLARAHAFGRSRGDFWLHRLTTHHQRATFPREPPRAADPEPHTRCAGRTAPSTTTTTRAAPSRAHAREHGRPSFLARPISTALTAGPSQRGRRPPVGWSPDWPPTLWPWPMRARSGGMRLTACHTAVLPRRSEQIRSAHHDLARTARREQRCAARSQTSRSTGES